MKVKIKTFDVAMEVKQNGVELEIRSPDGASFLGDCYITMSGLIWCEGKTAKKNGVKIKWDELMAIAKSEQSRKASVKAAKLTES